MRPLTHTQRLILLASITPAPEVTRWEASIAPGDSIVTKDGTHIIVDYKDLDELEDRGLLEVDVHAPFDNPRVGYIPTHGEGWRTLHLMRAEEAFSIVVTHAEPRHPSEWLLNGSTALSKSSPSALVWTQPDCPWCRRVEVLLRSRGFSVFKRDIHVMPRADVTAFKRLYKTVPQVVIAGLIIGGFEATERWLDAAGF